MAFDRPINALTLEYLYYSSTLFNSLGAVGKTFWTLSIQVAGSPVASSSFRLGAFLKLDQENEDKLLEMALAWAGHLELTPQTR
jgi:hypothetical protein